VLGFHVPQRRRLQDRIEPLVTKAIATPDPTELDAVIAQLREALHEHARLVREVAADKLPGRIEDSGNGHGVGRP